MQIILNIFITNFNISKKYNLKIELGRYFKKKLYKIKETKTIFLGQFKHVHYMCTK